MKKLIFMLLILSGLTAISCNSNSGGKSVDDETQAIKDREMAVQDSIQKANQLQAQQQAQQDSIENSQIKGYSVKKISGNHKYGGKTKIKYTSLSQMISDLEKKAEKEMTSKEDLKYDIDLYKETSFGGQIRLDIDRGTIGAADTEYFTIIIKDINDENELFRQKLGSRTPNYYSSRDDWWNIAIVSLKERIKAPFYVYVVDGLTSDNHKFEVSAIKK